MAAKADVFEIDLGGFTSSDEESEEKKVDIASSTPQSRSSRSSHSNATKSNKSLANGVHTKQMCFRDNTPSMSEDQARYDFKSKYFSGEAFVEKAVSDMTVSELVAYSNELNHGVKALDSEMQMMVYDNYNKFISATDTIRKMKDQVENMENEMTKLLSNISTIASSCSEIESKFSANRSEVCKLVSVRGLLSKLEFLFELPHRLKKNIELGCYERAVAYYDMASSILQKYNDIASFSRISIESQEIMNDLRCALKKEMIQRNIGSARQLQIAQLLVSLGCEAELLWYDIFLTRKDALLYSLHSCKQVDSFVSLFSQFVDEYRAVFGDEEKASAALTSFTRDIFAEYFIVIRAELSATSSIDELQAELCSFYDGLHAPSVSVPSAKLQDRGTEIIEHCIRRAMQTEFAATRHKQWLSLCDYLLSHQMDQIKIAECIAQMKLLTIECLNRLVTLTTNESHLIEILDLNFDDQLWSYTANIFDMFVHIIPIELRTSCTISPNALDPTLSQQILQQLEHTLSPPKLLILSKIVIQMCVKEIIKHFRKNYLFHSAKKPQLGIYKQEVLLFEKYCQECAAGLRLMYAQRRAQEMIENETQSVAHIIVDMKHIYHVDESSIQNHTHNKIKTNDREYDKLFNEQSLIYDVVNDNANDVLFTTLKIVFKHYSETLRITIIQTKAEKRKIDQKVAFWRQNIPKIIKKKDFKKLQTLLDEIQQGAKERYRAPAAANDTVDID